MIHDPRRTTGSKITQFIMIRAPKLPTSQYNTDVEILSDVCPLSSCDGPLYLN
jgi:hypothetical protein